MSDIVIRFLLGGAIVSAFAIIGEVAKPKTFAGIFGAAPSVALATLALAFSKIGSEAVATKARWMALATAAMFAYCVGCVELAKRERVPVWIGAGLSWVMWIAIAFAIFFAGRGVLSQ